MKIQSVGLRESARMKKLAGFDAIDLDLTHDMMKHTKTVTDPWA